MKKIEWKRILYMIVGVACIGIGTVCLRFAGFGTDPFSCMNLGVSNHLPISYGTCQLALNLLMFIPVIVLCPKSFGIGALFNMFGIGYIVELCLWLCSLFKLTVENVSNLLAVRILFLVVGIVIFCFGVALYMECDLGVAPYDMIGQIAEDRTGGKIKFKWVRVSMDILCMLTGFLLGGSIGVATVGVAFFTGPVVSWFRSRVRSRLQKIV